MLRLAAAEHERPVGVELRGRPAAVHVGVLGPRERREHPQDRGRGADAAGRLSSGRKLGQGLGDGMGDVCQRRPDDEPLPREVQRLLDEVVRRRASQLHVRDGMVGEEAPQPGHEHAPDVVQHDGDEQARCGMEVAMLEKGVQDVVDRSVVAEIIEQGVPGMEDVLRRGCWALDGTFCGSGIVQCGLSHDDARRCHDDEPQASSSQVFT